MENLILMGLSGGRIDMLALFRLSLISLRGVASQPDMRVECAQGAATVDPMPTIPSSLLGPEQRDPKVAANK